MTVGQAQREGLVEFDEWSPRSWPRWALSAAIRACRHADLYHALQCINPIALDPHSTAAAWDHQAAAARQPRTRLHFS